MNTEYTSAYLSELTNGTVNFDPYYVEQIENIHSAPLPHLPGEVIEFVEIKPKNALPDRPPVIYIPGFTEGIIAKAPFGIALAELGEHVIIPDQNRAEKVTVNNASAAQARNYLAIIEANGWQNQTVNFAAHSLGGIIVTEMAAEAKRRGWTCFDEARIAMLAPAGHDDRGLVSLASRFAKLMLSERGTDKELSDETGLMMKAGTANFMESPVRTLKEVLNLNKTEIRYEKLDDKHPGLIDFVGKVIIFGYTHDAMFPAKKIDRIAKKAMQAGAGYATPVAFGPVVDENGSQIIETYLNPSSGRLSEFKAAVINRNPSTHNDEQFNPRRVAGAVSQFFDITTH
ncbi:MAG: alpha/beta hydrolase [bacterium]|nr:alpha/beta hydrolase [bacterium]